MASKNGGLALNRPVRCWVFNNHTVLFGST